MSFGSMDCNASLPVNLWCRLIQRLNGLPGNLIYRLLVLLTFVVLIILHITFYHLYKGLMQLTLIFIIDYSADYFHD